MASTSTITSKSVEANLIPQLKFFKNAANKFGICPSKAEPRLVRFIVKASWLQKRGKRFSQGILRYTLVYLEPKAWIFIDLKNQLGSEI